MSTISYKVEVQADNSGKWYSNALRFATMEEAEMSARKLFSSWYAVREIRAAPCTDEVNYQFINGENIRIEEREYDGMGNPLDGGPMTPGT